MFGGGIKDKLLCRLIADCTGKKVITGPIEAASIGNILLQAISSGYIKNIFEARRIHKKFL